jgi:hypothetical protein
VLAYRIRGGDHPPEPPEILQPQKKKPKRTPGQHRDPRDIPYLGLKK